MASLNELLQNFVNCSYEQLLDTARISMACFKGDLDVILGEEDAALSTMIIFSACLGVDGTLSELEYKFICDFLGKDYDYGSISKMVAGFGDEAGRNFTDKLIDSFSDEKKVHLLTFCLCFLSVDERISHNEIAFIYKLIA